MTIVSLRRPHRVFRAAFVVAAVACDGSDLTSPTGDLQVAAATSGAAADLDPDGYTVAVDGGAGQSLPINGSVTFLQLAAGTHTVRLTGVAPNCTVSGQNPASVTVTAGATAHGAFQVACAPLSTAAGSLEVTAATSGAPADLDQDGYTVALDGAAGQALPVNGSVTFSQLAAGTHTVVLSGVAANCTASAPNPAQVTVTAGATVHAAFQIACAPLPGLTGRIAFVSDRDGNAEIYVMNANGTGVTRLTNNEATDGQPGWSPDGTKLVFVSNRDGNDEIYVMNADGSGVTRLSNNAAADKAPAWSPDGSKIAFVTNRDGNDEIYVMNADGSGVIRLTNDAAADKGPAWSPDGSKIAFLHRANIFAWDIDVMNADGSGVTRLTNAGFAGRLAWGRTGMIVFDPHIGPAIGFSDSEIAVVTVEGAAVTPLTNNSINDDLPTWSPDGSKIAFESDRNGNFEIYVMNASGTGVTQLTNDPASDGYPAWGP